MVQYSNIMLFQLSPSKGNVSMGSGLQGWGFNLRQFARMYALKFGVREEKMMTRLWGDNFYDPETSRWSNIKGEKGQRGFNKFVLEPLFKVSRADNSQPISLKCQLLGFLVPILIYWYGSLENWKFSLI